MPNIVQIIVSVITIIGAGIAAYVGVRVAIAEIRGDIKLHDKALEKHDERFDRFEDRVKRLEQPFFEA